jgi:hypothetical protein
MIGGGDIIRNYILVVLLTVAIGFALRLILI